MLGLRQLGSTATFFVPRWVARSHILYHACGARAALAVENVFFLRLYMAIDTRSSQYSFKTKFSEFQPVESLFRLITLARVTP